MGVRSIIGLAVVLAGCGLLPAGRTAVTLPGGEGYGPVPVVLDDPGAVVATVDVGPTDADSFPPTVAVRDGDSVVVGWLGGACDDRTRLRVVAREAEIGITIHTDQKLGLGCTAVGIRRSVTITFNAPLGGRSVVLDEAN